jgi:S-formylglutathione hydrolase FrmB
VLFLHCGRWKSGLQITAAVSKMAQSHLAEHLSTIGLNCAGRFNSCNAAVARGAQTIHQQSRFRIAIHTVEELPARLMSKVGQTGLLESMRFAYFVFSIAMVLAFVWASWAWWQHRQGHRYRHRILRRAGGTSTIALLVLLAAAIGANAYAGYVPSLDALVYGVNAPSVGVVDGFVTTQLPIDWTHGAKQGRVKYLHGDRGAHGVLVPVPYSRKSRLVEITVGARSIGITPRRVFVYLPPGYTSKSTAARYPVIYLIHGYPGTSPDWLQAGGLQQTMDLMIAYHLIMPMIVALPQTGNSWFDDTECLNLPRSEQVETYLASVVVHAVDTSFRTIRSRGGRSIGGMSSGSFCALNLALRHQHVFSVVSAIQPFGDPGRDLIHRVGGLKAWRANSPRLYINTLRFTSRMAVLFDAGANDSVSMAQAQNLGRALAARGQYVAMRFAPGQSHTWWEAHMELPYSLAFAARQFTAPAARRAYALSQRQRLLSHRHLCRPFSMPPLLDWTAEKDSNSMSRPSTCHVGNRAS